MPEEHSRSLCAASSAGFAHVLMQSLDAVAHLRVRKPSHHPRFCPEWRAQRRIRRLAGDARTRVRLPTRANAARGTGLRLALAA